MQEDLLNGKLSGTVVTTQIDEQGIALLFDYIDDETMTTEAVITDNFIESNYAVQDHIAIKPKIYRLRGCVGEVVFKGGSEWLKYLGEEIKLNHPILQKTLNAMKPITAISGIVGSYTQAAMNIVKQIESSYNRYSKIIKDIVDPNPISGKRQQELVSILNYILQNRIAVNLKNLKFNNELILPSDNLYEKLYFLQSVSSHQGNNDFITDIEITIKEVRMATTKTSTLDSKKFAAIGAIPTSDIMKDGEVYEGKAQGNKTDIKISDVPVVRQLQQGVQWVAEGKSSVSKVCQDIANKITASNLNTGMSFIQNITTGKWF